MNGGVVYVDGLRKSFDMDMRKLNSAMEVLAAERRRQELPGQIAIASTASEACKNIQAVFEAFERSINPDEEIGLALSSFGVQHQIIVERVSALGVNLIVIRGIENGVSVSLVQHLSQLSFLLIPVKKAQPEAPRRKIGFGAE